MSKETDAIWEYLKTLDVKNNLTWETVYPVGSIYMSVNSTSPETLFGGEWTPIQGRFLVAQGNNQASGDEALNLSAGASGGKAKQIIPYHRHTLPAINTGNASQGHTHTAGTLSVGPNGHKLKASAFNIGTSSSTRNAPLSTASLGSSTFTDGHTISGSTGGQNQTHQHTITEGKTTNYSADAANGATPRTSDNSANANLPPYLAVYMWKRTA